MSKDAGTPRVFLIRHGETEWSKTGKYTGRSDIPLLPEGEERFRSTANAVLGQGKLIEGEKISRIYVSPRQRSLRTRDLILEKLEGDPSHERLVKSSVETEAVAEWGYGDYEGLLTKEIRALRKERDRDQDSEWDIWRDGCEGDSSEQADQVTKRVDEVIDEITSMQHKAMTDGVNEADVIVVAHGHILRAFVKRWLGFPMETHFEMMLEPGGVCGLSYAHGNIEERALLVGMSLSGN